jgi:hypothetical protein
LLFLATIIRPDHERLTTKARLPCRTPYPRPQYRAPRALTSTDGEKAVVRAPHHDNTKSRVFGAKKHTDKGPSINSLDSGASPRRLYHRPPRTHDTATRFGPPAAQIFRRLKAGIRRSPFSPNPPPTPIRSSTESSPSQIASTPTLPPRPGTSRRAPCHPYQVGCPLGPRLAPTGVMR